MRSCSYHPYIDDWMRKVDDGKVLACQEQKMLMPFVRTVLDNPNVEIRHKVIDEGVDMLHRWFPFQMHDFQLFRFALFYGLFEKGTDFPVFNETFNLWGRGTGKNGIASMDAFYLVSDYNGVLDYDVDFVANNQKQAMRSFEEIHAILKRNPKLRTMFDYTLQKIQFKQTGGTIGYLTSNAETKDGGRQGAIIFDEVHMYEDYDMIGVLIGGLGKVKKPRIVYLSTDGFVREAVVDDLKEKSYRVMRGEEDHNGFLPIIFKLDHVEQMSNKDNWSMAIPRLPYDRTLSRQVAKEYEDAQSNMSLMEKFVTKRMNLPYISVNRAVATPENVMRACRHEWPDLENEMCVGGVDYADRMDFSSVGLRFRKGDMHYFKQHTFIHERSMQMTKYRINLQDAVNTGHATIIRESQAPTIPAEVLVDWFIEQAQHYHITDIKCDLFRVNLIREAFEEVGLPVTPVRSGSVTHNMVAPTIQHLFTDDLIGLEDDKLMRWYISNVKVETDKKGNKTFHKIEPIKRKTDGFFCLLHTLINDELQPAQEVRFFDMQSYG